VIAAVSGEGMFSTPLPTTKTFTCILLAATVHFFLLILLLSGFKLALLLFVIHNRSWIAKSVALCSEMLPLSRILYRQTVVLATIPGYIHLLIKLGLTGWLYCTGLGSMLEALHCQPPLLDERSPSISL